MPVLTKADLKKKIRQIRKRHPNTSEWQALEIYRQECDQKQIEFDEALKSANTALHRLGYGMSRGLFMESPKGVVNGKMTFTWGPMLYYGGLPRGNSALRIAMDMFQLNPERILATHRSARTNAVGEYSRTCKGCGEAFVSTRSDAQCCSAKCRKRMSRMNVTLISNNGKEGKL